LVAFERSKANSTKNCFMYRVYGEVSNDDA
jgi:hypothetical protein